MKNLSELLSNPEQLNAVPREALPALIGEAETLKALLWARLQAPVDQIQPAPTRNGKEDRLLTVGDAGKALGVSKRWMYRHADTLPFTRKLASGTLRFSERGLERWRETRGS